MIVKLVVRPNYIVKLGLALFVLVACPACTAIHKHKTTESASPPIEIVDVGGGVQAPGSFQLTDRGLTLRQAIIRAGGLRWTPGSDETVAYDEAFVVLTRRQGVATQNVLIPLSLVEQDIAGEIQLEGGDLVQLTNIRNTSLVTARGVLNSDNRAQFSVAGLVNRPSLSFKNVTDSADPKQIQTLGDVAKAAGGRREESTVMTLTRRSLSGFGWDIFILPLNQKQRSPVSVASSLIINPEPRMIEPIGLVSTNQDENGRRVVIIGQQDPEAVRNRSRSLDNIPAQQPGLAGQPSDKQTLPRLYTNELIHHGDAFVFTRLEVVPLVLTGLVTPVARERAKRAVQQRRTLRERHKKQIGPAQ